MVVTGITFIIDGSQQTKDDFTKAKERLLNTIKTLTVDPNKFTVPIVIYNGDKIIVFTVRKPEDIGEISAQIKKLPFVPSTKPSAEPIKNKVKEVTAGKEMKVVPIGAITTEVKKIATPISPDEFVNLYRYSSKYSST